MSSSDPDKSWKSSGSAIGAKYELSAKYEQSPFSPKYVKLLTAQANLKIFRTGKYEKKPNK